MGKRLRRIITGSGRYIPGEENTITGTKTPGKVIPNSYFEDHLFYTSDGDRVRYGKGHIKAGQIKPTSETIKTLENISTITERRYADDNEVASDLMTRATEKCIGDNEVNIRKIKCCVGAHNFGDLRQLGTKWDSVPSKASVVKYKLKIKKPWVEAYDLIGSKTDLEYVLEKLTFKGEHLVLGRGIDSTNPEAVYEQAKKVMDSSSVNKEDLDSIIVLHDSEKVECLAEKTRNNLGIKTPGVISYDVIAGCPGGLQGMRQLNKILGPEEEALLFAGETLSKVAPPGDMNKMLYGEYGGALSLRGIETDELVGILATASRSDTLKDAYLLKMGKAYDPHYKGEGLFFEMDGHALRGCVLERGHEITKIPLDKLGLSLKDINLVNSHQANGKMIRDLLRYICMAYGAKARRSSVDKNHYINSSSLKEVLNPGVFAALSDSCGKKGQYSIDELASVIMPTPISHIGNGSVSTNFIVYDLVARGDLSPYEIKKGDIMSWVSMGAGLNFIALVTRAA